MTISKVIVIVDSIINYQFSTFNSQFSISELVTPSYPAHISNETSFHFASRFFRSLSLYTSYNKKLSPLNVSECILKVTFIFLTQILTYRTWTFRLTRILQFNIKRMLKKHCKVCFYRFKSITLQCSTFLYVQTTG